MRTQGAITLVAVLGVAGVSPGQAPAPHDTERLEAPAGIILKRIPAGTFLMGLDPRKSSPGAVAVL